VGRSSYSGFTWLAVNRHGPTAVWGHRLYCDLSFASSQASLLTGDLHLHCPFRIETYLEAHSRCRNRRRPRRGARQRCSLVPGPPPQVERLDLGSSLPVSRTSSPMTVMLSSRPTIRLVPPVRAREYRLHLAPGNELAHEDAWFDTISIDKHM
jgi:hypothetical protein